MFSKEDLLTLIEDLQRDACSWGVHLQITKALLQKRDATDVLAKKKCKINAIKFEKKKNRHWLNIRAVG